MLKPQKTFQILFLLLLITISISCKKDSNSEPEVFDETNKPFFTYNEEDDSYLLKPWNYELKNNAGRTYPLVIYLHGKGYNGKPPSFVGYENDEFKSTYPSFVYMPHSAGQYNVDILISKLENILSQYRIDLSRIYIIGYSMGAYWSAPLANKLKDEEVYFAGIVSQAGLSNHSNSDNSVLDKTSIWIHLGDQDGNYNKSQERFDLIKEYLTGKGGVYNTSGINISGSTVYTGTTETITLKGLEVVKNTVYENVGHGVSHFPFNNPEVMEWLFSQNSASR